MKQSLLLSTAFFSLGFFANAQNWVNGGNNLSAIGRLGTTSNQSVAFITSNTERARITNGGNFGIGTGSPLTKLHVNGFGSFGNRVTSGNATRALNLVDVNAVMRVLRVDASNAPAVELISRATADGANLAYWDFFASPSDASFRIRDRQFGGAGLDRVTITHGDGSVGIGTSSPSAKLHVVGSTSGGTGIYATGYDYGIQGVATGTYQTGVYGYSDQGYGVWGYSNFLGVYGYAGSGNYGTYGYSGNIGAYGYGTSYGTYGSSSSTGAYGYGGSYGVFGSTSTGTGVYGSSTDGLGAYFYSANYYGIRAATGLSSKNWAGVFDGNVYSFGAFQTSDRNLKKNITELGDAMSIINKLKPKNYEFRTDEKLASLHLPKGSHYGLIAQDLQEVLPNLVSEVSQDLKPTVKSAEPVKPTADGKPQPILAGTKDTKETTETMVIKAVNYVELIPVMVKAMQELKAEKDKEIADLKTEINELKSLIVKNGNGSSAISIKGYLKQNTPNPSNNNTIISYYTPEEARNSQILITNMKGSVLKAYTLSKGEGQLNISNAELPAGTYNYTLYVNSNKIDTKQMVIIK